MSCPDPDVFNYGTQYVAACTSDFGQDNPIPNLSRMGSVPAAFPIYVSSDLHHWRFVNYIFPPGHSANGAFAPSGGTWPGEYWAPEIHKIGSRWVAYFGAQIAGAGGEMGLFVAWTDHLFGGNWSSKLLYRNGGVIDPSVAWIHGKPMIVYCHQPSQIWESQLTRSGVTMLPREHEIAHASLSWENGSDGVGVEEGPVLWTHNGATFVLYNAASTWDNTYKIGLLMQRASGEWWKDPAPVLESGSRLVSVGIGAQPFRTPHGLELALHIQFSPASHNMEGRYLSRCPRALQKAVHSGFAGVEHLGHLRCAKAEHVPQDEHCALLRREVLQPGDKRQGGGFLGLVPGFRPRRPVGDPLEQDVGVGLEPDRFSGAARLGQFGHRLEPLWPARARPQGVDGAVGGDPVKPRPDRCELIELLEPAPRREQGLLDQVFGVLGRADDPIAVQLQLAPVRLGQFAESVLVPRASQRQRALDRLRCLASPGPSEVIAGTDARGV